MNKSRKTLCEPVYVLCLEFYKIPQHPVDEHIIEDNMDQLYSGEKLLFNKNIQDQKGDEIQVCFQRESLKEKKQSSDENYKIEAIVSHCTRKKHLQFKVRWKNFLPMSNTWIDEVT
jgi:hypothetical protein